MEEKKKLKWTKKLKQLCLLRWGCIPTDLEWVDTVMEGYMYVEVVPAPISQSERARKDLLVYYYRGIGISYS